MIRWSLKVNSLTARLARRARFLAARGGPMVKTFLSGELGWCSHSGECTRYNKTIHKAPETYEDVDLKITGLNGCC